MAKKKATKKKAAKKKAAKKATKKVVEEGDLYEPESDRPYVGQIDGDGVMHVRLHLVDKGETKGGNSKFGFPNEDNQRFLEGDVFDAKGNALDVIMPANTIIILKDREKGK